MQLKLKRTQRDSGIISKTAVFMLDAWVQFTPQETDSINRYKLWNQHVYSSESAKESWAKAEANRELWKVGLTGGGSIAKSLAHSVIASFKLNITITSLYNGQHIECKSLDELLFAEDCIRTACLNLREYLDLAATFTGTEILIDYSTNQPEVIATAVTPQPKLIVQPSAPLPAPPPAIEHQPQPVEYTEYEEYSEPKVSFFDTIRDPENAPYVGMVFAFVGVLVLIIFFASIPTKNEAGAVTGSSAFVEAEQVNTSEESINQYALSQPFPFIVDIPPPNARAYFIYDHWIGIYLNEQGIFEIPCQNSRPLRERVYICVS